MDMIIYADPIDPVKNLLCALKMVRTMPHPLLILDFEDTTERDTHGK